jgi:hypothetical protein
VREHIKAREGEGALANLDPRRAQLLQGWRLKRRDYGWSPDRCSRSDLTGAVFGPLATMFFADQAADVIKIEPLAGDITRRGPALA